MSIEQSKKAINSFIRMLKDSSEIPKIDISENENPLLFPLYEHIRFTFAPHWVGIVITDTQGVYTPIEEYNNNIIHLLRLPKYSIPVYAISDLRSSVYAVCDSLIIVFQGVYKTLNSGYNFIDYEYYIRPIPGISFEKNLIVQHVTKKGVYEVPVITDSDNDDEDDGLD